MEKETKSRRDEGSFKFSRSHGEIAFVLSFFFLPLLAATIDARWQSRSTDLKLDDAPIQTGVGG